MIQLYIFWLQGLDILDFMDEVGLDEEDLDQMNMADIVDMLGNCKR